MKKFNIGEAITRVAMFAALYLIAVFAYASSPLPYIKMYVDTVSNLPAPTKAGQAFAYVTDLNQFYYTGGSTWVPVGPSAGGSSDRVAGLTYNSSATGDAAANSTAINAALANAGDVTLACPAASTVYVNATLLIYSNSRLHVDGKCTVSPLNTIGTVLTNRASQAAWTTIYDNSGLIANGPLSVIRESDVTTWAHGTAFVKGNYSTASGNIYWESAASCTASGSGSGPSGTGTGISDNTCSWNYVTTYTNSAPSYPTSEIGDPGIMAVINWPSHGLSLGAAVWITPVGSIGNFWDGSGTAHQTNGPLDTAYMGVFPVVAVNDTNNITVILRRPPAAAFTGIPMLIKAADQNIIVDGNGTWDFNYPTVTACTAPVGCRPILFAGLRGGHFDDNVVENSNTFDITLAGVSNFEVLRPHVGPKGNVFDFIKLYAPIFDVTVQDVYGASAMMGCCGDDFVTMAAAEQSPFQAYTIASGDFINVKIDNLIGDNGLRVGAWMSNSNSIMDQIEISRVSPTNGQITANYPGVVTFYNPSSGGSWGGKIGHLRVHDILYRNSNSDAQLPPVVSFGASGVTVDKLDVEYITLSSGAATGANMQLVFVNKGTTINQVDVSHVSGSLKGSVVYVPNGTVKQVNWYDSSLTSTSTGTNFIATTSPGVISSVNIHDNIIFGSFEGLVYDNNGMNINLHDNYMPDQTLALVSPFVNNKIHVSNNYMPNSTHGLIDYSANGLTSVVTSGGGNELGNTWFTNVTGTSTSTVYGFDIKCDVTKLTRTTGEYCFNTNTSPGSGSLATSELVTDFGTSAGSWKALFSTTTY